MNVQTAIEQIASNNVRRHVLMCLVGSMNASLIGSAQSLLAGKLADYDVCELSDRDIENILAGPDERSYDFDALRAFNALRLEWASQLSDLTGGRNTGNITETIQFMVSNPKSVDTTHLSAIMEAAGIPLDESTQKLVTMKYDQRQKDRASKLAQQRGMVEFLIDHFFAPSVTEVTSLPSDAELPSNWAELSAEQKAEIKGDLEAGRIKRSIEQEAEWDDLNHEMQLKLEEKYIEALHKARDACVMGLLDKSRNWTFGDLPIISALIKEVQ